MNIERRFGLSADGQNATPDRNRLHRAIALRLASMGHALEPGLFDDEIVDLAHDVFARYAEQARLLARHQSGADHRIQAFLDDVLDGLDLGGPVRLPEQTFILEHHGLAKELSLPVDGDHYENPQMASWRLDNGVLHNPVHDRRTTKGVFHVADYGLPVPADKIAVPLLAFGRLLRAALDPPPALSAIPFTSGWKHPVHRFVSLYLRPVVVPEVTSVSPERTLEVSFFAPGGLVANLDFVESIFGNAGDPYLPESDAGLDAEHWTGHSGCVILAPHLTRMTKKELGLPHFDEATERQRTQGMCWRDEGDLYNDGTPFKITCRDRRGVMVTVITDSYFGYCKKEVKTQISMSANLFGEAEEEHAGGALAFPSYHLGDEFRPGRVLIARGHTFEDALRSLGDRVETLPDGHAVDRRYPEIHYLPDSFRIDLHRQDVCWKHDGEEQHLKLLPGKVYVHPSGYKVHMERHPHAPVWNLIGTVAEGTYVHKPSTVSGGGKSEISKRLDNAVLSGALYVQDFQEDMDAVQAILDRDYADRFRPEARHEHSPGTSRPVLSPERSTGSVIKLLTPSEDYTDEYNTWLQTIPNHVLSLVFVIKRLYRAEWNTDWRRHFSVDVINGVEGHELKYKGRRLMGRYLRVGLEPDGAWRTFKVRQDFSPSAKVQMEDDISASVTVPSDRLVGLPEWLASHPSLKLTANAEWRLFQRPDDAVIPGFDKETEEDMAGPGLFASNYEAMTPGQCREVLEDVVFSDAFTPPMKAHLQAGAARPGGYGVCPARPRLLADGSRSKNPRYLQVRPDVARPRDRWLAEIGTRLNRRLAADAPVHFPVAAIMSGRRNNPPEPGIRPLCVFNPLHYQDIPELFMEYVTSITGKSPSTTGAGSEGALTKGPFNALRPAADLNAALLAMVLCGYDGYSSAAGWVGPRFRVDHDVSLLVPEIWARLTPKERDARWLLEHGYLEPVRDFDHGGRRVLASRLGQRITAKFVRVFLGRIFDTPTAVFPEEMLQPEKQDLEVFVDGVDNIVEAQRRVARAYFEDGSIEEACPPLQALLQVMAEGHWQGKDATDPSFRRLFTRESILESDWYARRLRTRQARETALLEQHVSALKAFLSRPEYAEEAARLDIAGRLHRALADLERVRAPGHLETLRGTLGTDPLGDDL